MIKTKGLRAFILALAPDLEPDLVTALAPLFKEIGTGDSLPSSADVVFCSANIEIVKSVRAADPARVIIVVSRFPEVNHWLDSLESGANDYCAAPFESSQLNWILQSSQHANQLAA